MTVKTLKIGLKKTNTSSAPYISNIYNVLDTDNSPTSADISTYINYITSLLSDVYNIASTFLSVFEDTINDLFDDGSIDTTLYSTGTHSYATFEYPSGIGTIQNVSFDNAPMPVEFSLASASSATTGFVAYSEISYFVQCIEQTTASLIRLSISCEDASTSTFYLTVSS